MSHRLQPPLWIMILPNMHMAPIPSGVQRFMGFVDNEKVVLNVMCYSWMWSRLLNVIAFVECDCVCWMWFHVIAVCWMRSCLLNVHVFECECVRWIWSIYSSWILHQFACHTQVHWRVPVLLRQNLYRRAYLSRANGSRDWVTIPNAATLNKPCGFAFSFYLPRRIAHVWFKS